MSDHVIGKAKQKLAYHEEEARKLREFLATYESLADSEPTFDAQSATAQRPSRGLIGNAMRAGTRKQQIIDAVANALGSSTEPMTTSELLPVLENQGVHIDGNPVSYVSSVLSRWDGVTSVTEPRRGWVLTRRQAQQAQIPLRQ